MTTSRRTFLGSILGAVALASPFGLRCRRTTLAPVTTGEDFMAARFDEAAERGQSIALRFVMEVSPGVPADPNPLEWIAQET